MDEILKQKIKEAKQNPNSTFAKELRRRIESGQISLHQQGESNKKQTPKPQKTSVIGDMAKDVAKIETAIPRATLGAGIGATKGVLSTGFNLGKLGSNIGRNVLRGVEKITGLPTTPKEKTIYEKEQPEWMKPVGTIQKLGYMAEQLGEFLIPSSKIAKLEEGTSLLTKSAIEAGTFGGTTAIQEGEIDTEAKTSALVGAIFPFAGAIWNEIPKGIIRTKLGEKIINVNIKANKADRKDGYKVANVIKYNLGGSLKDMAKKTESAINKRLDALEKIVTKNTGKVDVKKVFDKTASSFEKSKNKFREFGSIGATKKAIKDLSKELEEVTTKGTKLSLPEAVAMKRGAGTKGAWAYGVPDRDARALKQVYTKFYSNLKTAIEKSAGKQGKEIKTLNKEISDMIPISNALIRRMPVEQRNQVISLTDALGLYASIFNPKALSLIGIKRLLRTGKFGAYLARSGTKARLNRKPTTALGERIFGGSLKNTGIDKSKIGLSLEDVSKFAESKGEILSNVTPVYRGQPRNKLGKNSVGIGKSFTTDKKIAEVYGNEGKIIDGFVDNSDILKYNELDANTKKYVKSIINERIDTVKKGLEDENIKPFEELVFELGEIAKIENKKAIDISSFGIPSESEIRVLSKDAVKTKSQLKQIIEKKAGKKDTGFKGLPNLTLKTVEKLKGKTTVSKQFIYDLTNSPDLKQAERDLVRKTLDEMPEGKVNVQEFVDKIKTELLPLKVSSSRVRGYGETKYENISLPPETRGNVANYDEHIYNSPIKTSAGNVHFSNETNYFAHTRIEDMAKKDTRRIIELQSDLFQKGRLKEEFGDVENIKINGKNIEVTRNRYTDSNETIVKPYSDFFKNNSKGLSLLGKKRGDDYIYNNGINVSGKKITEEEANKAVRKAQRLFNVRKGELSKMEPYRNTWHERIIKEEIKQASKDGKTKLQFPTGETAMKIEGLGEHSFWVDSITDMDLVPTSKLKIGQVIRRAGETKEEWIITEVLGDGKFKAVPKDALEESIAHYGGNIDELIKSGKADIYKETFDISGKVDTSDPIYRFYEKTVQKYLKRIEPDMERITDDQGVEWFELPINKAQAKEPITAFGKAKIGALITGAGTTASLVGSKMSDTINYKKTKTESPPKQPRTKKTPPTGNIAQRHNNPGNLIYAGQKGATRGELKSKGVYWAKFKTVEAGFRAMEKDIRIKMARRPNLTIEQLIKKRSPGSENNLKTLMYNILDELWDLRKSGKMPNLNKYTKVSDVPMSRLSKSIAKAEGFYAKK